VDGGRAGGGEYLSGVGLWMYDHVLIV